MRSTWAASGRLEGRSGITLGLLALPFCLNHGLGQDTLTTGLYMTPWPLTVALVDPLAGRLADRVATAWLCAVGAVYLAAGLAAASLWPFKGDPFAAGAAHRVVWPGVRTLGGAYGIEASAMALWVWVSGRHAVAAPCSRSG